MKAPAEIFPANKPCNRCRREGRGEQRYRYMSNRGCISCQKHDASMRQLRQRLGVNPNSPNDGGDLI